MLTNHVVSLELARELKEVGWSQHTTFFQWIRPEGPELSPVQTFVRQGEFNLTDTNYSFPDGWEYYAAPLASELMERMPDGYFAYRRGRSWFTGKDLRQIAVAVASVSMPDALAKLYIHLIKQGIVKV